MGWDGMGWDGMEILVSFASLLSLFSILLHFLTVCAILILLFMFFSYSFPIIVLLLL
jgi:hypothetical protein